MAKRQLWAGSQRDVQYFGHAGFGAWATWPAKQMALHPGPNGEYSAARWIAPAAGPYTITALFTGIGSSSTTDVHVFVDGKAVANGNLTRLGDKASYQGDVSLSAGAVVMFVVGRGTDGYGGDTTGLTAAIKVQNGETFTPTRDFSFKKNPNGPLVLRRVEAGGDTRSGKLLTLRRRASIGGTDGNAADRKPE